jgi:hypothetical protein
MVAVISRPCASGEQRALRKNDNCRSPFLKNESSRSSFWLHTLGTNKHERNWNQKRGRCVFVFRLETDGVVPGISDAGKTNPSHLATTRRLFGNILHLLETERLPRQARDRHRESTQKRDVCFLSRYRGAPVHLPGRGRARVLPHALVRKRVFLRCHFIHKCDLFTKTGSGQT